MTVSEPLMDAKAEELLDATVVICTRNRGAALRRACVSVLDAAPGDLDWELMIVDNASTDDTPEVASALAAEHPGRLRLVQESEIGLSAARNAGVAAARGGVVAFLDDDATVGGSWLVELVAALRSGAMAAGGPVRPELLGERPRWLGDVFLPYLSAWDRGSEPHVLTFPEYPRGANVAFRREAFARYGGFATWLGRRGAALLSGEELEMCLRLERGGERVVYVPSAAVDHEVPVDRLTPEWMARRFAAQGLSEAMVYRRHGGVRGVAVGLVRYAKNAAARPKGAGAAGAVLARCRRRALAGYLRGAAQGAWTLRLSRRSVDGRRLARWP